MSRRTWAVLILCCTVGLTGCGLLNDNKTDADKRDAADKTRDEVAKATERAKPELQKAGRKLKDAADSAAEQAHAAAQGLKEGWERGGHGEIDLNSATENQLTQLPGITPRDARRIIAARPYSAPHELVSKGVLSAARYADIRDHVTTD